MKEVESFTSSANSPSAHIASPTIAQYMKGKWFLLPCLGALTWLVVLSVSQGRLRSDVRDLSADLTASSFIASALLPTSHSMCLVGGSTVAAGTPMSTSAVDGGVVAGAGVSAYIGARKLSFTSQSPSKVSLAKTDSGDLLVGYSTGSIWNGDAASFIALIPAVPDWLLGDTLSVDVAPGSLLRATQLPFPLDSFDFVGGSGAINMPTVVFVGAGQAVAALINASGSVQFGGVQAYESAFNTGAQLSILSTATAIVSYYCTPASGLLSICCNAMNVTFASGVPNVVLGPQVVFASNHETHVITRLTSNSFAVAFPLDNASTYWDDESVVGTPLGVVVGVVQADLSIAFWGSDGSAGTSIATPWLQPWVHVHYFLDIATITPANGQNAAKQLIVVAAADRSIGDAIRLFAAVIHQTETSVTLAWGDMLAATQGGADAGYHIFRLLSESISDNAGQVTLVFADSAAGGLVDGVVASAYFADGSLCISTPQFALQQKYSTSTSSAAINLNNFQLVALELPWSSVLQPVVANLTLVETLAAPRAIASSSIPCGAHIALACAISGAVPRRDAYSIPGSPVYTNTRGQTVSSVTDIITLPSGQVVATAVSPDSSFIGLQLDENNMLLAPALAQAPACHASGN